MTSDEEKIEELTAIIRAVSERARSRYPESGNGDGPGIRIPVADLMPVVHARDAAQAKIAAIGSVNPRSGGLLNRIIQTIKKLIARSLRWFVRDQVTFNRETISAVEALTEALNEHNRILVSLAAQTNEQLGYVRGEMAERVRELSVQIDARADEIATELQPLRDSAESLRGHQAEVQRESREAQQQSREMSLELQDMRTHWSEWRGGWEKKLADNEIQFLRSAADLQGAFQHRVTQIDSNFRQMLQEQHSNYLGALDRSTLDVQKRLWEDMQRIRIDYERLIHNELRIVRQRAVATQTEAALPQPQAAPAFDYGRFAERFRGSEEYVRHGQSIYKDVFAGCGNVLDIGCGRGEFLETMRDAGITARGVELSDECVALCRHKGLSAEKADMFQHLASLPEAALDGILCSQVVEHLPPESLPALIRLCAAKLAPGGILAMETPNPECLAIFATHFYLDPTHTRPVPHPLLAFYMEEEGFGQIEVHRLAPLRDSVPEVLELPEGFREKFFGALDYAITGRRL